MNIYVKVENCLKVSDMKVELKVVGIRNYLDNREADYPKLFERLPIGSTVYLRKQPEGAQFPGCVYVLDDDDKTIGSLTKTERRYIELEIPKDEMLPVKISGHSAENNCLYIEAENTKGFNDPYILQIKLMDAETVIPLTDRDQEIKQLTSSMNTKIKALKEDGNEHNVDSLLCTARKYQDCCCQSLDGDTSFSRGDICQELRNLSMQYPELKDVYSDIYEKNKDLGRKQNDVKTQVFREQKKRIYERAILKKENGKSFLDYYTKKLKISKGGCLTEKIIREEILNISQLLSKELENSYEEKTETEDSYATSLYSLNYNMESIYILFTREIKREYLQSLLDNGEWRDNEAEEGKTRLKDDHLAADRSILEEDLTFLIHFKVIDNKEKVRIHKELKNLVRNYKTIGEICKGLKEMKDEGSIQLPWKIDNVMDELQRLGMPDENTRGFSYKNFENEYKKILKKK